MTFGKTSRHNPSMLSAAQILEGTDFLQIIQNGIEGQGVFLDQQNMLRSRFHWKLSAEAAAGKLTESFIFSSGKGFERNWKMGESTFDLENSLDVSSLKVTKSTLQFSFVTEFNSSKIPFKTEVQWIILENKSSIIKSTLHVSGLHFGEALIVPNLK